VPEVKIFWVLSDNDECFFGLTKKKAEYEVQFRQEYHDDFDKEIMKTEPELFETVWSIKEEVHDIKKFGACINHFTIESPCLPACPDCSVGKIRKIRSGSDDYDFTCGTCPYFKSEIDDFWKSYGKIYLEELVEAKNKWWRKTDAENSE